MTPSQNVRYLETIWDRSVIRRQLTHVDENERSCVTCVIKSEKVTTVSHAKLWVQEMLTDLKIINPLQLHLSRVGTRRSMATASAHWTLPTLSG